MAGEFLFGHQVEFGARRRGLKSGQKLCRADLEKHFKISTATAKRDMGDLADKIEFIGTGKTGYYAASERERA
jgi:DeoR/GlpR family transcriptional regulator of sugar metabolism